MTPQEGLGGLCVATGIATAGEDWLGQRPGISGVDYVRNFGSDEMRCRNVDRRERPADQERASTRRLPTAECRSCRDFEGVEHQRTESPSRDTPRQRRPEWTHRVPGWTGHSLYLEVELLEGGHQVSGALNPWRVGAVVGERTTIACRAVDMARI